MLDLILQTPGALPPLVWGTFGVAKTAKVYALAKALKWHCEVVIASTRQPEDFGGIGIPDDKEGLMRLPDAWVTRVQHALETSEKAVVFADELSCTPPATQSTLLRGILEGVWGDAALPKDRVKYIAAANPPDEAAGGWDLAMPLANRFTHVSWEPPSVDQWQNWLMSGASYEEKFTVLDLKKWEECWGLARAHVAGFLRRFPELYVEDPKKDPGRFPPAYARPRTWENAARLLATVYATKREDAKLELLAGSVGPVAATKFATWLEEANLPDPEELLKAPNSWQPDPKREDVTFAVLNAVANAAVLPQPNQKMLFDRWKSAWIVLENTMKHGKDLVVIAGRTLADKEKRPKGALTDTRVKSIISSLTDVLKESGVYEN